MFARFRAYRKFYEYWSVVTVATCNRSQYSLDSLHETERERDIRCLHAHGQLNNLQEFMISIYFEVFRSAFIFDPKCSLSNL